MGVSAHPQELNPRKAKDWPCAKTEPHEISHYTVHTGVVDEFDKWVTN